MAQLRTLLSFAESRSAFGGHGPPDDGLTIAPPDAAAVGQVPVRGLTGYVNGGMVTLIGTTSESPPNRAFSVVDDGTTTPAFTILATAGANTAFRGISISPQ